MAKKSSSKFSKPSLLHIIALGLLVLLGIWMYFHVFHSKPKSIYHMEKFLNKKETFHDGLKNCEASDKPNKLFFFFMETCPHCVDFKPIWKDFVEESKNESYAKKVCIADVSAENDSLLTKYSVSAFPTVLLIKSDGTVISFDEKRTLEDLKRFVSRNIS